MSRPREEPRSQVAGLQGCLRDRRGMSQSPPPRWAAPGLKVTLLTRQASQASPCGHSVFQALPTRENVSSKGNPF